MRAARALLLHVVLAAGGTVVVFRPTLESGFSRMQSDPGDTVYLNYVLEHATRALAGSTAAGTLWSPPFFFPNRNSLAYSENLLTGLPVYAVLRGALAPDTAYQAWCITVLALLYAASAWTFRRLSISTPLAGLGAFVLAYGLQRASHLNHGQLLPAAFTPLALLALVLHVREPSRRRLAALLGLSLLQVVAGIYLGWLLLLGCAVFAGLLLGLDPELRRRQWRFVRTSACYVIAASAAWVAGLTLFLRPYFAAAAELPARPWADVLLLLPRPRSWISAPPGSLWSRLGDVFPPDTPLVWEHRLFLGAVPCALVAFGLLEVVRRRDADRSRRVLVLAALATVLVLGLLSLRLPVKMLDLSPGGERLEYLTAWSVVYDLLPGATSIRAVGRIWTVMLPLVLMGGLVALETGLGRLRRRGLRACVAGAILVFGVAEQHLADQPSFDKLAFRAEVAATAKALSGSACDAAYVQLDPSRPFFTSQLAAMWGGLEAGLPVVNGYSGSFPPGYPDPTRTMTEEELRTWLAKAPPGRYCIVERAASGAPAGVRVLGPTGVDAARPAP